MNGSTDIFDFGMICPLNKFQSSQLLRIYIYINIYIHDLRPRSQCICGLSQLGQQNITLTEISAGRITLDKNQNIPQFKGNKI